MSTNKKTDCLIDKEQLNNMKENIPYTLADLLENKYFIHSVLHPAKESESYWLEMQEKKLVDPDDYELACHYIRNLDKTNQSLTKDEMADMWTTIHMQNSEKKENNNRKDFLLFLSSVACIAGFIFILFTPAVNKESKTVLAETKINIETIPAPDSIEQDIQFIFADNSRILIKENHTEIAHNENGEATINSTIIEKLSQLPNPNDSYNQVVTPKGRFSSLTFSDGTRLWMNASSRVVYPPVFKPEKREIYLEGEAYIEVTPDTKRPFIVKTEKLDIQVLGTSFNITAYKEQPAQTVVLVSGSVAVKPKTENSNQIILLPDQLFRMEKNETTIQQVDVKRYISWKEGYYICENDPLKSLFNYLNNYYGITIQYEEEVGQMTYSGKFDLKENAERVLKGLTYTAPIEYRKDNEIHYLSLKP
ncbi:MAG: FecR domain-containing protein [Tannerellaceae bacterium]|nr:FecR domain-containing protein [Tannerellaceae bacterium]